MATQVDSSSNPSLRPRCIMGYWLPLDFLMPSTLEFTPFPGLEKLELLRQDTGSLLLTYWRSLEDHESTGAGLASKLNIPLTVPARYATNAGEMLPPVPWYRQLWNWICSAWKGFVFLLAFFGLIWSVFSEHYVHFFAAPEVELFILPVGNGSKPLNFAKKANCKIDLALKNSSLRSPCIVNCKVVGDQEANIHADSLFSTFVVPVGEKRVASLEFSPRRPGLFKIEIKFIAKAGMWRSGLENSQPVLVKVWDRFETEKPRIQNSLARVCNIVCPFTPGIDSEWRAEATIPGISGIQFSDASFQQYAAERPSLGTADQDPIAVARSTRLRPFEPVLFRCHLTSSKDLDNTGWLSVVSKLQVNFDVGEVK